MMRRLIGLSGLAHTGKDTAYGFIKEWGDERGYTVRREAFADRLKLSAARIFFPHIGLYDAVQWCNALKETGRVGVGIPGDGDHATSGEIGGREFLQHYGTEAHRDVFGYDFWVDQALSDLNADIMVITDCRFENEAHAIRDRGGDVWRIERPMSDSVASAHASEQPLPEELVDLTLFNTGSLDDFRQSVFDALIPCATH